MRWRIMYARHGTGHHNQVYLFSDGHLLADCAGHTRSFVDFLWIVPVDQSRLLRYPSCAQVLREPPGGGGMTSRASRLPLPPSLIRDHKDGKGGGLASPASANRLICRTTPPPGWPGITARSRPGWAVSDQMPAVERLFGLQNLTSLRAAPSERTTSAPRTDWRPQGYRRRCAR
jgi:hypothetical protein